MAAKYIVTSEPGTYVPGIGFVKPGEVYTAPPGHIPSRTALPVNAEAGAELKKLQAELQGEAKRLAAVASDEKNVDLDERKAAKARAKVLEGLARSIRLEPVALQRPAPAIEEGLTIAELEGVQAGGQEPPGERAPEKPQPSRKL